MTYYKFRWRFKAWIGSLSRNPVRILIFLGVNSRLASTCWTMAALFCSCLWQQQLPSKTLSFFRLCPRLLLCLSSQVRQQRRIHVFHESVLGAWVDEHAAVSVGDLQSRDSFQHSGLWRVHWPWPGAVHLAFFALGGGFTAGSGNLQGDRTALQKIRTLELIY